MGRKSLMVYASRAQLSCFSHLHRGVTEVTALRYQSSENRVCSDFLDLRSSAGPPSDESASTGDREEWLMKLSSLMLGACVAIAVIAGVLWVLGFGFHPPITEQGAALYNANNEVTATGVVQELQEFDCPVSEHELGAHLKLQTADA